MMTVTTNQLATQLNEVVLRQIKAQEMRGITGRKNADGSIDLDSGVPIPGAQVHVRSQADDAQVVWAWLNGYPRIANIHVRIIRDSIDEWHIIGADEAVQVPISGVGTTGVFNPGQSVITNLDAQKINWLRVSPFDGLTIKIEAGWYPHKGELFRFPETTIDLTAAVPGSSNQRRWTLVGIDPVADSSTTANGAAQVSPVALSESAISSVTAANTGINWLGAVQLYNGQTEIIETDIVNLRPFVQDVYPDLAAIDQNLIPATTDTFDIGSASLNWDDVWANNVRPDILTFTQNATPLTISSGAITVTDTYHIVAAETGTTDNLITINGGSEGQILIITADAGDVITVAQGIDNIVLTSSVDKPLGQQDALMLIRRGSAWLDVGGAADMANIGFNITPDSNGTRSFGSASRQWGAIYTTKLFVNGTSPFKDVFQARLTGTSGDPTPDAAGSGLTSLYLTPFGGDQIALYDGTNWLLHTITEISLSISSLAGNSTFDMFVYNNAGTLTLQQVQWKFVTASNNPSPGTSVTFNVSDTSGVSVGDWIGIRRGLTSEIARVDSIVASTSVTVRRLVNTYVTAPDLHYPRTRATAIALQNNIPVKSGDTGKRYVGTFFTNAAGATEDSSQYRLIANYYNRVQRSIRLSENTVHTYTSATFRPWNVGAASPSWADIVLKVGWINAGASFDPQHNAFSILSRLDYDDAADTGTMQVAGDFDDDTTLELRANLLGPGSDADVQAGTGLFAAGFAPGWHFLTGIESGTTTPTFRLMQLQGNVWV